MSNACTWPGKRLERDIEVKAAYNLIRFSDAIGRGNDEVTLIRLVLLGTA